LNAAASVLRRRDRPAVILTSFAMHDTAHVHVTRFFTRRSCDYAQSWHVATGRSDVISIVASCRLSFVDVSAYSTVRLDNRDIRPKSMAGRIDTPKN